jgi:hypothetical protein
MDTTNDILGILDTNQTGFTFTILSLFKIPFILLLLGNIFFVVLLFLRVRILADTFNSPNNRLIQSILRGYIGVVIITSLVALLFLIIA